MTVLVIDDDPFTRRLLQAQLHELGVGHVVGCESGAVALAQLATLGDVDGILCDLQMPNMDGVEFLRHLGVHRYSDNLVLISGESRRTLVAAESLARSYHLNVRGILEKPVCTKDLRRVLEHAEPAAEWAASDRPAYPEGRIREALRVGELFNVYQPKVRRCTGMLAGVEALVRWRHPSDGIVFPDQFVATAEQAGLMSELTDSVLREAVRDASHLRAAGLEIDVAVNVSMDNLSDLSFPDRVVDILAGGSLPRTSLYLEVTESQIARDQRALLETFTRLRLKGVKMSIDDFGTGHSSLVQLRTLPFDELKLDRGFVHDAHRDPTLEVILRSNLGMARDLGLQTVAEGVEDQETWMFLGGLPVDLIQGYLVSRPLMCDELNDWAAAWSTRVPDLLGLGQGGADGD